MLLEMNVKLRRNQFDLTTQLSVNEASVGLIGKSGAGKSTLLDLISGVIQPQSGRIVLDGKILFDSSKGIVMPREQRPVGAVLQCDEFVSVETVRDHLVSVYSRTLKQRRLFKPGLLVDLLELGHVLDRSVEQLSSGERQRVAIARSLLKSPRLLLLDDIFPTLGNHCRMKLLPVLKRLQYDYGMPVLYASQSLSEILELTDRLVVLENGKILHEGSLLEVTRQDGMLNFLGIRPVDNLLTVSIQGHDYASGCTLADCFGLPLILPFRSNRMVGEQTQVSVRANDIALSHHYIAGISIQNQVKGRICALIPRGKSVIVQIDCGAVLLAEITPRACQDMGLREGLDIYCLIKTHSITYLSELDTLKPQKILGYAFGNDALDAGSPAYSKPSRLC